MGNIMGNFLGVLFVTIVIVVILFLVFREVVCWYWKINQNLALLTEIRDLLAAKGGAASSAQQSQTSVNDNMSMYERR